MNIIKRLCTSFIDSLYRMILSCKNNIAVDAKIINVKRVKIGNRTSISFNSVLWADGKELVIGSNSTIHPYVYMRLYGGSINIGNNVYINPFSILYGHGGLTIGNDVLIAGHVMIIPANHLYLDKNKTIIEQGEKYKGIKIGNDVWIGSHAVILDGVSIGDGCVIAAGAIVTTSTEPYTVYAGIPASKIKSRHEE